MPTHHEILEAQPKPVRGHCNGLQGIHAGRSMQGVHAGSVHASGPFRVRMQQVYAGGPCRHPCRRSIQEVLCRECHAGSAMRRVYVAGALQGVHAGVHARTPYRGPCKGARARGPCRGSMQRVHADGPFRGFVYSSMQSLSKGLPAWTFCMDLLHGACAWSPAWAPCTHSLHGPPAWTSYIDPMH
jgi:hypothetical protein